MIMDKNNRKEEMESYAKEDYTIIHINNNKFEEDNDANKIESELIDKIEKNKLVNKDNDVEKIESEPIDKIEKNQLVNKENEIEKIESELKKIIEDDKGGHVYDIMKELIKKDEKDKKEYISVVIRAFHNSKCSDGMYDLLKMINSEKNDREINILLIQEVIEYEKDDEYPKILTYCLGKAIEADHIPLMQQIIGECCRKNTIESMSVITRVLPQLALRYPNILSYALEKSAYKFGGSIRGPDTFDTRDPDNIRFPDYVAVLPGLFNRPKLKINVQEKLKASYLQKIIESTILEFFLHDLSCFQKLAFYRSAETFKSPIFDAIVMYMYREKNIWIIFSLLMFYYAIHFGLFIAVISNTNRNEKLQIA
ncbi:3885_t:CDS:1, partial [Acaulospora colombiana]